MYFPSEVYGERLKNLKLKIHSVPLRFRKVGRVRCGGARETHLATCHNGVTPIKTKEFLKSSFFSDLNGTISNWFLQFVSKPDLFADFCSHKDASNQKIYCFFLNYLKFDAPMVQCRQCRSIFCARLED